MNLDRHRVAQLLALSAAEQTLKGAERDARESDVAIFIKGAYDDASDAARAPFMSRVAGQPGWPWSAVRAGPKAIFGGGGGGGGGKFNIEIAPPVNPPKGLPPPALLLLMGATAPASPGDVVPQRGIPTGVEYEPLYAALDKWDTTTIASWSSPQGWRNPFGAGAPKDEPAPSPPPPAPASPPVDTPSEPGALEPSARMPALPTWVVPAAATAAGLTVVGLIWRSAVRSAELRQLEQRLAGARQ